MQTIVCFYCFLLPFPALCVLLSFLSSVSIVQYELECYCFREVVRNEPISGALLPLGLLLKTDYH